MYSPWHLMRCCEWPIILIRHTHVHTHSLRPFRTDIPSRHFPPQPFVSGPAPWGWCQQFQDHKRGRLLRWSLVTECNHFPGHPGLLIMATRVKRAADFHYSSSLSEGWLPYTQASELNRQSHHELRRTHGPGIPTCSVKALKLTHTVKLGIAIKVGCVLISRTRCANSSLPRPSGGETWELQTERSGKSPRGAVCLLDRRVRLAWLTDSLFPLWVVAHGCNKSPLNPLTRGWLWTLVFTLPNKRKVHGIPHGLREKEQQSGGRWEDICWECFSLLVWEIFQN